METTRAKVVRLVLTAIDSGDYNYIREAMDVAYNSNGEVFMAEDDTFVMVDDEVFYFNGAF